jgi:hypothetical protein
MSEERPLRPDNSEPVRQRVWDVIGDLNAGKVTNKQDRQDLRRAVDKADAAPTGIDAQNIAVGRISTQRKP